MAAKLVQVVGYANSGKTTLVERLVRHFIQAGSSCAVIKHSHHHVTGERPGSDTARYRLVGANPVVLIAAEPGEAAPMPAWRYDASAFKQVDWVFVEGFKNQRLQVASYPKLEVWRSELGHPLLASDPGAQIDLLIASSDLGPCSRDSLAAVTCPWFPPEPLKQIVENLCSYFARHA